MVCFTAHIGRLVLKQNPKDLGRADVSNLDKDPIVVWRHNHYVPALPEFPGKSRRRRPLALFGNGPRAMIGWLRHIMCACPLVAIIWVFSRSVPASSAWQGDKYGASCHKSSCSILLSYINPSLRLPSAGRLQILLPVFQTFCLQRFEVQKPLSQDE
jgi:hypothetical protein